MKGSVASHRYRVTRAIVGFALVILTGGLLSACGGGGDDSDDSDDSVGPPKSGGTLTFARAGEPTTLDPNNGITDNPTLQMELQIFDQLVELRHDDPGKVVPGLAESWSESPDGLSWTFNLRDAKFSNGEPVTSADVVYSLERVLDPKIDPTFAPTFNLFVKSVAAPDPKTVVIELKHPYSAVPEWLSFNVASVVPKDVVEQMGEKEFAQNPIGSGAFMLESWQHGSQITLARNPHYWRTGLPYLDKVVVSFVPSDNTRVLQVTSGEVDIADDMPFAQIPRLEADPSIDFVTSPGSVFEVFLNLNSKPLEDIKVRQALNYATPKAQINEVVFKETGEIANSIGPKVNLWSEDVEPYPDDIDKAKDLIAQSSVPDGFDLKLEIVGTDEPSLQTAQILQEAWGDIGVDVQLEQVDISTAFTHVLAGNYGASMLPPSIWTSDIPSEDEFYLNIATDIGKQLVGYDNEEVTRLMRKATTTNDEDLRAEIFPQVQQLFLDDPAFVPIVFAPLRAALQKDVEGFGFAQTGWSNLDLVWLDR